MTHSYIAKMFTIMFPYYIKDGYAYTPFGKNMIKIELQPTKKVFVFEYNSDSNYYFMTLRAWKNIFEEKKNAEK